MIKSKKILIALAVIGANMFAHNAFAADGDTWYGDGNNATVWAGINIGTDSYAHWNEISGACATGANLTLTGSESDVGGIAFGDAKYFFAGHSREGNVTNNILTVSGGTFAGGVQIHGGCSFNGNVSNNKVNIDGSPTFQGFEIYGGRSAWGNAVGNELTFACNSGDLVGRIYGGYGLNAFDNTLTISGGTFISGPANGFYAGYAHLEGGSGGDARGNKLNITGGDFSFDVGSGDRGFFGGLGADVNSNVIGNIVNITGGTFTFGYSVDEYFDGIFGGKNIYTFSVTGIVSQNVVNIYNGANIKRAKICGGYSKTGDADNNTVNIYGGSFGSTAAVTVYGGYHEKVMLSDPRTISCNAVNIYGGTFSNSSEIYGGYNLNGVAGGDSADKGNKVVIENVTFNSGTGNKIYGGYADGSASKADYNSVTINNGTFESTGDFGVEIVGGENKGNGQASNNKVVINNGTFKGTGNFSVEIVGGKNNGDGQALNNKVIINGGTFEGSGSGKIVIKGGETTGTSNAYYNEVIINNGSFKNFEIYGGYSGFLYDNNVTIKGGTFQGSGNKIYGSNAPTSMANANQQIILEGGIFTGTTSIIAVDGNGMPSGSASTVTIQGTNPLDLSGATLMGYENVSETDRVLNVNRTNVKVGGIKSFGTINFTLPKGTTSDDIVLRMQGSALDLSAWNVANITVNTNGITLGDGDYITLMQNVNGSYGGTVATGNITVLNGDLIYYTGGTTPTAKADYTITHGGVSFEPSAAADYNEIIGNQKISSSDLNGWNMVVRGGTYNGDFTPVIRLVASDVAGANISNNHLTIHDGTFNYDIFGVKYEGTENSPGILKNNSITINAGVKFDAAIYVAYAKYGNLYDNILVINDGTFVDSNNHIYSAYVEYGGNATHNTIVINGGNFSKNKDIIAGRSSDDAINNETIINGGTFGASDGYTDIYGGYSGSGNVKGNKVKIAGGSFTDQGNGAICGGYLRGGSDHNVTGNEVNITGGSFKGVTKIFGAYKFSDSGKNKINGNKVNINNVCFDISSITYGDIKIAGGYDESDSYYMGNGETKGNEVTLSNVSFKTNSENFIYIYGGYNKNGIAENNVINIIGGEINLINTSGLYGGRSFGTGSEVKGNIVNVCSGNIKGSICGGHSVNGNAVGNIVNIYGGNFGESSGVYGGQAGGSGASQRADGNIMNILGGTFADDCSFYGGYSSGTSSDNILNLKIKMSGKARIVGYFQTMNFTLPSDIANGDTMIKTKILRVDIPTGGEATINVYAANGVKLKKDDVITLVDVFEETAGTYTAGSILGGAAELCVEQTDADANGDSDNKDLVIKLLRDFEQKKSAGNEDQQKAPVEGMAAAVQTVNMSADLASGDGMKSLIAETAGGATNTFGAMSAGSSKYKTGSHVDVDGWGVLVGAGKTRDWKDGSATTYGLFFEYGKGDFDTYNGNVHGDGNSENKGVGIMARHKLTNNTYYEGNIRYGKQETEWSQSELGGYDMDSRYYGIMVGMGHIYPVGKNEIDVYGRYTYGHVGACDATLKDSKYHFDSVKSHRVRVGAKYNFVQEKSNAKPYIGLAWEHEFKGEARASISGVGEAPAPSMKGNTGIMEVGCDWKVSKKWTLGLGANAYIGKRKGWDGMARIFYNF
ncbi:MAG: autotransporter outer membrane beta-barrel domain-containing protein [Phascolarctobacterium sp.]|nr:autotransporter outer membrane beta-barrel domain-containing protein [Phascolarctobacterium sp.]